MREEEKERLTRQNATLQTQLTVSERYADRFRQALAQIMAMDDKSPQGLVAAEALKPK